MKRLLLLLLAMLLFALPALTESALLPEPSPVPEAAPIPAFPMPRDADPETAILCSVLTADEAGAPVPGVRFTACDDSICLLCVTDDAGLWHCTAPAGTVITLHLLSVPEGFAFDPAADYPLMPEDGETVITLVAE